MAETQTTPSERPASAKAPPKHNGPPLHVVYALPAPIRTFPLPAFYPNNPISLFHVAYAWLQQFLKPPATEPSVVHQGVWSPATTSVHVTNDTSMRALWEQGFYGKGSLSRSEPNWLKREEVRQGLREGQVSENITIQRREDRALAKWERARLEQEAIRQIRLEEARKALSQVPNGSVVPASPQPPSYLSPVGPLELLALPNSLAELAQPAKPPSYPSPVGPLELLALPNSLADLAQPVQLPALNGSRVEREENLLNGDAETKNGDGKSSIPGLASLRESLKTNGVEPPVANGLEGPAATNGQAEKPGSGTSSPMSEGSNDDKTVKRRKSVRFSPTVESTTFEALDPPSPNPSALKSPKAKSVNGNVIVGEQDVPVTSLAPKEDVVAATPSIVNKEHLQLMPEEAFFLSFGLGALAVEDPATGMPLSTMDLFTLFRQYSYFPPRIEADDPELRPDDNFLVHYAVYHHFRSLGWVPRAGIKFGVDWLLYTRGPVFDHAEFGLIVIPSYTDPLWEASGQRPQPKTWQWMHSIVRVLSHVTKSLVLVYVDIPPPTKFDEAVKTGFVEVFRHYKVREVMVKRWSSNRNR